MDTNVIQADDAAGAWERIAIRKELVIELLDKSLGIIVAFANAGAG